MHKRIKELAEGKVERKSPAAEFSVSRIEIETAEGKDFKGEIKVTGKDKTAVRGIVYSSNPRMECLTEGFDGEEVCISYKFHGAGLVCGDVETGEFVFVCMQREYTVPFTVTVGKAYAGTMPERIQTLSDFAGLAQRNWKEAGKLFYSPDFSGILKHSSEKERLLHKGLAKGVKTDRNLEEFLLACRLKEAVFVEIEQKEYVFFGVKEKIFQEAAVTKNTWGYVEIHVFTDADFIIPKKRWLLQEDFLGSRADFGFYLDPKKMHAGKNFGRLILKSVHQEISVSVCAVSWEREEARSPAYREIQKRHVELMQIYADYRLRKIVTGRWASLSCKILDELTAFEPKNAWYRLLKAQTLWTNGQKQEAEWILDEFKRKFRDRRSPVWGYYMYICTLMEREELYISRLTDEIEQIYLECQENLLLFWCLLFLRKDYENSYQKLKALERRIMEGADSPLLYVEAYELFAEEPYLIRQIGEFEIKILNWARKRKMLTKAIVDQVISVFPERLFYRKTVLLLLKECYHLMDCAKTLLYEKPGEKCLTDEKSVLSVICGYLIRNQKWGEDFFEWYALGVEKKLRITGLYEAYLMSMDAKSVQEVPQIIQMYFKYNNQLGNRQKAVLYVNMIAAKERQPEAFRQNYPAMEKFAYEQMERGRIDDNLAVIYKEVLSCGIYSKQVSDALSGVVFMHRLTCSWTGALRVVVCQKQTAGQTVVPLIDQAAYFPLYSNDYSILIEDRQGNRYSGSVDYQLEKLMYPGRYLKTCMKYSPEKLPYLFYYFSERTGQKLFTEKDLAYIQTLIASGETDVSYKARLFPKMFSLMNEFGRTEEMQRSLLKMDPGLLTQEERCFILKICMENRLYDVVCQIAKEYGFGKIAAEMKVPFLDDRIRKLDFAEDKTLLLFCMDTFLEGKYNDAMLAYLCRFYAGPVKLMEKVFFSAQEFGVCTKEIAGRILVQMLYTEECPDCADDVYRSYKDGGIRRLKEAYLTFFSYCSLEEERRIPEHFFDDLREWHLDGREMNGTCALALLRHYTKNPSLMQREESLVKPLLEKYLFQGMYFAFYRKLSRELLKKYQLFDKYYVEYRTRKDSRVWIRCAGQKEEVLEEMPEVCEGFFVKKMILFFGEEIRYSVLEETDGKIETVKSGFLRCEFQRDTEKKDRYERLNEMLALQEEGAGEELFKKMAEYEQLDRMTNEMFTIIR